LVALVHKELVVLLWLEVVVEEVEVAEVVLLVVVVARLRLDLVVLLNKLVKLQGSD